MFLICRCSGTDTSSRNLPVTNDKFRGHRDDGKANIEKEAGAYDYRRR
jgi:hypothetical protein